MNAWLRDTGWHKAAGAVLLACALWLALSCAPARVQAQGAGPSSPSAGSRVAPSPSRPSYDNRQDLRRQARERGERSARQDAADRARRAKVDRQVHPGRYEKGTGRALDPARRQQQATPWKPRPYSR